MEADRGASSPDLVATYACRKGKDSLSRPRAHGDEKGNPGCS